MFLLTGGAIAAALSWALLGLLMLVLLLLPLVRVSTFVLLACTVAVAMATFFSILAAITFACAIVAARAAVTATSFSTGTIASRPTSAFASLSARAVTSRARARAVSIAGSTATAAAALATLLSRCLSAARCTFGRIVFIVRFADFIIRATDDRECANGFNRQLRQRLDISFVLFAGVVVASEVLDIGCREIRYQQSLLRNDASDSPVCISCQLPSLQPPHL